MNHSDSDSSDGEEGPSDTYWKSKAETNRADWTTQNSLKIGLHAKKTFPQVSLLSRQSDPPGCSIDFKTLTQWTKLDPHMLVQIMTAQLDKIKYTLSKDDLPADWVHLLAVSFQKVTQNKTQVHNVTCIMEVVAHSNFLDCVIPKFFSKLHENRHILSVLYFCVRAFFDILDYITIRYSDCSSKCFVCVCKIEEVGTMLNILHEGNDLFNQFVQLKVKSCPIPLKEGIESNSSAMRWRKREQSIPMNDEESPPDDFTEQSIFPDIDELETSTAPFLRANKTTGPYRDFRHYTDVHFRLLREDYLSPLREGLKAYKLMLNVGGKVETKELRFYYDVKLVKMEINDNDGIHFIVKFHLEDLDEVKWEFSKRFMFGALLCFSKDHFQTIMFATVINRDSKVLEKGLLEVCFQSNLEQVLTSPENESFVIAETVSFFESYKHVLEGLQEVKSLPLYEYILYCCPVPRPPEYLRVPAGTSYDIGCIMKEEEERKVQVLKPSDWPSHENTLLNAAQLDAVKLALTNELAIIQGPPGTGKTYVGLHIMDVLLKNRPPKTKDQSPILVVCYTNHALDQFLEGIFEFCSDGIIRVGGRSRSEKLESCNLKALRQNPVMDKRLKKSISVDLRECRKRLKKISHLIKQNWQELLCLDTNIQNVSSLRSEMTPSQALSLKDPSRGGGSGNEMNVWLKASNANVENHLMKVSQRHLIKLILLDGETMPDDYLLSVEQIRISFKYRAMMYREWLGKYKADKEDKLSQFLENRGGNRDLLDNFLKESENASKDILQDEDIQPYMSCEEVYDKIKNCVKQESRGQHQSTIKSWLLGPFQKVEDILDEIKKMTNVKLKTVQQVLMPERKVHSDRVVIDDSDDDDLLGFQDSDSDSDKEDDDELSSGSSEANKMVVDFRDVVINFKESEKREIALLQRAKILHIDIDGNEDEEDEEEEEWSSSNEMTYSKVFKLIKSAKPLIEEEANEIDDVWSLPLRKRYSLYKLWMMTKKTKIADETIKHTKLYNEFLRLKKKALSKKDVAILKKGKVIGMTTTGAARMRSVLQEVKPQIIIVEEAAEVLEAHIVTTLNKHCKHLILIGDHQQLRPNPTVHTLAVDYDLEISLFERLVKNEVKHITLQVQHRMRPQISRYLLSIYPDLRDHQTVSLYGNVKGVASNVYFLHHEYRESSDSETTSKANAHEAKFLTKLCKYFLQQGYIESQITVLAAYSGQVKVLRECMEPEEELYESVRVTSIDNYQGEESDIILLSLVRSNLEQDVGFLKVSNRVCVALSRARLGLYVIGNLQQLERQRNPLWKTILAKAKDKNEYGVALKLVCSNHSQRVTYIQHAEDFALKVPEGGCDQICGAQLFCGHTCPRMCHISDPTHCEMSCQEPCLHKCSQGHPCLKRCWEECGDCEILVEREMPFCGHKDMVQCYVDAYEAVCKQPCKQRLLCGHLCQGFCGVCSKTDKHKDCEELVEKTWHPCGDKSTVHCCTDTKITPCRAKCREKLRCGDFCRYTCGECLTKRVHRPCKAECKKALPCGHQCQSKCSMLCEPCQLRCLTKCRHTTCSNISCGEICALCFENCAFDCKHRKCSEKCSEECKGAPCSQRCNLPLKCKHSCSSICDEYCVCFKCVKGDSFRLIDFDKTKPGKVIFANDERAKKFKPDKETIFMKIPKCGHVFTLKQLDQYVNKFDPGGSSYIRCPRCHNTLQGIIRYDHLNKARSHIRENRKCELEKSSYVSQELVEALQYSLDIVEKFCPFDLDFFMRHKEQTIRKSHADALRLLARFAFILNIIVEIHREFNAEMPFHADKWKDAIKTCQMGITPQYEEEMIMELHRLLILEQFVAYKKMVDDAEVNLSDCLKNQFKHLKHGITQQLTLRVKGDSESVISELYEEILSSGAVDATRKSAEILSKKTFLAKTILDQPKQLELSAILEASDILPVPLSGDQESQEEEEEEEDDDGDGGDHVGSDDDDNDDDDDDDDDDDVVEQDGLIII